MDIVNMKARQVLDSRGCPTVEVDVMLKDGSFGRASVPSGASKGSGEAVERRDNDRPEYCGKGVLHAVDTINGRIFDCISGMDAKDQVAIDMAMINLDGTPDKRKLGANATLGVSLAIAKASAASAGMPLYRYVGGVNTRVMPVPMVNVLNGGLHAANSLAFQEFMVMPVNAHSFSDGLRAGTEVFYALKSELTTSGLSCCIGDEGGFTPDISSPEEALDLVVRAIEKAGYAPGDEVCIAIDCAATTFYNNNTYNYLGKGVARTPDEQVEYLVELANNYPIASIEDGMAEDDRLGWEMLTNHLGTSVQLVGDDLFVTDPVRLQEGIVNGIANAILVKPNQIGSITEMLATVRIANFASYETIMSHRSGETEDTSIADLSVAVGCTQMKAGSVSRSDRVAKYNQLLRIEEDLGDTSIYAGCLMLRS